MLWALHSQIFLLPFYVKHTEVGMSIYAIYKSILIVRPALIYLLICDNIQNT